WASRWWPASAVDGIAALDPGLLAREINELTALCEGIVDGADAETAIPDELAAGSELLSGRAGDYALAAGGPARNGSLSLGRGSGGWDWRYCPPGVLDASEHAVSWELFRTAGTTTAHIAALAAPGTPAGVPDHLRPLARLRTPLGPVEVALKPGFDSWTAAVAVPADTVTGVEVFVPGVGPESGRRPGGAALTGNVPGSPDERAAGARQRIRDLARTRLRLAGTDPGAADRGPEPATTGPLRAETAAAESDSDF
ncbi:hypothetical protein, partial [Nocardia sp. NPDC003345]